MSPHFRPLAFTVIAMACSVAPSPLRAQGAQGGKDNKNQKYVASNPNNAAGVSAAAAKSSGIVPSVIGSGGSPNGYMIGPDDELTISIWHEPELSQGVVVRPDGMITLPLLNDIRIAGLTTEEAQALLTDKLKTVVNDPQVTVIVKTIKSQKVFLVGNVAKQGTYMLGSRKTVLELIAEAGGLGPFAKSGSIYVLRKQNGKQTRLAFNYKRALSGKGVNPELNVGDMVVVP